MRLSIHYSGITLKGLAIDLNTKLCICYLHIIQYSIFTFFAYYYRRRLFMAVITCQRTAFTLKSTLKELPGELLRQKFIISIPIIQTNKQAHLKIVLKS